MMTSNSTSDEMPPVAITTDDRGVWSAHAINALAKGESSHAIPGGLVNPGNDPHIGARRLAPSSPAFSLPDGTAFVLMNKSCPFAFFEHFVFPIHLVD